MCEGAKTGSDVGREGGSEGGRRGKWGWDRAVGKRAIENRYFISLL